VSILSLVPGIVGSGITPEVIKVTNTLIDFPEDARGSDLGLNAAYLLSQCINAVLRLGLDALDSSLSASWVTQIIKSSWVQSPQVMGSVVGMCEIRSALSMHLGGIDV
jgi:hypothetical protein